MVCRMAYQRQATEVRTSSSQRRNSPLRLMRPLFAHAMSRSIPGLRSIAWMGAEGGAGAVEADTGSSAVSCPSSRSAAASVGDVCTDRQRRGTMARQGRERRAHDPTAALTRVSMTNKGF